MEDTLQNSISTDQLFKEYNWYENAFPAIVQNASDEFFNKTFRLELIGVSKNINCLVNNESCFVTKIRIDKEYDIFFRLTDKAIDIILSKILGQSKSKFNINKISELEAKIVTSFNDYIFESIKSLLSEPDPTVLKRNNFDVIHLTFIIREQEEYNQKAGKVIISLPHALLKPEMVISAGEKFSSTDFPTSETVAKIRVGKTKFSLYDIKHIEEDDVVVFDNTNLEKLTLTINGTELPVNLSPNMDLLLPEEDDNGGESMGNSHQNIWDSIEVEMVAEFDAVKITLGELKDIENGLVVDLTSLYDNNVTLKVEDKPIASGSLVIVNDRYGVKINNVIADGSTPAPARQNDEIEDEDIDTQQYSQNNSSMDNSQDDGDDEDFDYSDFELEDENI